MEKKYILTEETKEVGGHILHKIQAVRDFGDVQKGDLGGWVESEENLSHDGDCWISGNGRVSGDGRVSSNARIGVNAYISSPRSYFVQGPIGSRDDFLTCYLDKDKKIYAVTGCFSGTLEEFEKKVKETHGSNKHAKQYLKAAEAARVMLSED
ncbi:hypothetical protein [Hydrogeniiclostridium mannosilyticum]|jgi:conserved hypothetical protein|uniref:hypothetical protein n=1 Tax=Hydrogeniiclostridium mannosilyticum TaxID=2764322 RepID=UPI00399A2901